MPDALSLSQSDLPEEIEKAIDAYGAASWGDGAHDDTDPRSGIARSALTAAILSRLGEAEATNGRISVENIHLAARYVAADEALVAALARVERLEKALEWRPIETAPRDDEQSILVCDARVAGGFHQVVWWDADSKQPEYRWDTSDGPKFHRDAFTHWMPLPAPPAQETEAEGQDAKGGLVHEGSVAEGHAPALTEAGRLAIKDA